MILKLLANSISIGVANSIANTSVSNEPAYVIVTNPGVANTLNLLSNSSTQYASVYVTNAHPVTVQINTTDFIQGNGMFATLMAFKD